jgi:hypothetical protein
VKAVQAGEAAAAAAAAAAGQGSSSRPSTAASASAFASASARQGGDANNEIAEEDQPPELERMLSLRVDDDFDHITPIADEGFSITLHTTASDMSQIRYREGPPCCHSCTIVVHNCCVLVNSEMDYFPLLFLLLSFFLCVCSPRLQSVCTIANFGLSHAYVHQTATDLVLSANHPQIAL